MVTTEEYFHSARSRLSKSQKKSHHHQKADSTILKRCTLTKLTRPPNTPLHIGQMTASKTNESSGDDQKDPLLALSVQLDQLEAMELQVPRKRKTRGKGAAKPGGVMSLCDY